MNSIIKNKVLRELFHRKSFIISLAILIFFVIIATIGPMMTPYKNPYSASEYYVAGPYSVPSWASIFPQYKYYPPDIKNLQISANQFVGNGTYQQYNESYYVVYLKPGEEENVSYVFLWNYSEPYTFSFSLNVIPYTKGGVQVNVYMVNSTGYRFFLLRYVPEQDLFYYFSGACPIKLNSVNNLVISPTTITSLNSPYVGSLSYRDQILFPILFPLETLDTPGKIVIQLSVINVGNYPAKVLVSKVNFSDLGYRYGLLGTDQNGASVFAEYVIGARFDLELSLLASVIIVGIGLIIGLVAGYVGGIVDLILNSITDFFLTIPGLPLIIALETVLIISGAILKVSKAVLILLIISGLSWMATMKIIRSVTMSLRNRTFVEASRAMGAGSFYIIRKHILPNILGVVFAQIAYDVPVVILTESGLDFLGLGITNFPTWGNMLGFATDAASAANSFAWWWVLPPGLSIVLLSVAFYYIGTAIQDVLSPYKVRGE
jgi:peptide/nickel transport system permease protein